MNKPVLLSGKKLYLGDKEGSITRRYRFYMNSTSEIK